MLLLGLGESFGCCSAWGIKSLWGTSESERTMSIYLITAKNWQWCQKTCSSAFLFRYPLAGIESAFIWWKFPTLSQDLGDIENYLTLKDNYVVLAFLQHKQETLG